MGSLVYFSSCKELTPCSAGVVTLKESDIIFLASDLVKNVINNNTRIDACTFSWFENDKSFHNLDLLFSEGLTLHLSLEKGEMI